MWADNDRRGVAGDLTSRPYGSPKDDDQNRFSNQTVAFPMVFRQVAAWAAWASGSMVSRRVSALSWSPSSTASFKGFSGNERLQQCRDKAWAWIGMWGLHVGGLGQAWDSWRSPDPNPQNRDMLSFPLSPAGPWPAAWLRRRRGITKNGEGSSFCTPWVLNRWRPVFFLLGGESFSPLVFYVDFSMLEPSACSFVRVFSDGVGAYR